MTTPTSNHHQPPPHPTSHTTMASSSSSPSPNGNGNANNNHRRRYLPLESFPLSAFPRTTHNIAWSPDAELALACDDCVFLFIPEFSSVSPSPSTSAAAANPTPNPVYTSAASTTPLRQYDEAALRFPVNPVKGPALNRHLFSSSSSSSAYPSTADADDDGEFAPPAGGAAGAGTPYYEGAGSGTVTSQGSSLNHVVALGWSGCGLGRAGRAVLGVLTGAGILTVYCEGRRDCDAVSGASFRLGGRNARALRSWVAAWGVGGGLVLPVKGGAGVAGAGAGAEYVTAFAWARELGDSGGGGGGGRVAALLAYENDDDEVVVVLVQVDRGGGGAAPAGGSSSGGWQVEEVARFDGGGPHFESDPTDPDYSPSGSSFSLSWSPWLREGNIKTSILSYTARGYVGFRQVRIEEPDDLAGSPAVHVGDVDASGVCLYLAPDAFVVWEDMIWTIDDSKVCRGIIATPARVKAFQLPFDATSSNAMHTTDECGSAYPLTEDALQSENPITGLVIHPPSSSHTTTPVPWYSLVRLSATSENRGWYQTNLPPTPTPNLEDDDDDDDPNPRWVTEIRQAIERQLPRAFAYQRMLSSPGASMSSASASPSPLSSDDEDDEDLYSDSGSGRDGSDDDEDEDDQDENMGSLLGVRQLDTADQVHTTRVRIWGMAGSPGGGTTAVFVSEHSTVKPERDTYAGLNCRVLFGRHRHGHGYDEKEKEKALLLLSTEARMWEWIYGGGPPVPGISFAAAATQNEDKDKDEGGIGGSGRVALKDHFALVARQQACAFCDTRLESFEGGRSSRCGRGHVFENCVATQIPILAPGTSNTCGVCGSKCLKPAELAALAPQPQLRRVVEEEISGDRCGGCGGKFIN
ncbi:hypothetical protein F5X96DRAFT_404074 [Biscogniauxia mediterranea]|nr:hypothetical protein F5X96DRAFT_404074 [Biscogniauxia mediterranea]